jgi:predicted RNA-binding protein with RPS1 domain
MPLEVGSIVEGKVSGITAFGAFIQLPEGKTGLVHISEVAQEYVKDISTHLKYHICAKTTMFIMLDAYRFTSVNLLY